MVQNVGALKSKQDEVVEQDIRGVVEACHRSGAICKVILETTLLTNEEKVRASDRREKCWRGFRENIHWISHQEARRRKMSR